MEPEGSLAQFFTYKSLMIIMSRKIIWKPLNSKK